MKEIKNALNSVKNDLNSFNETVSNLSVKVSNLENHQNQLSLTFNASIMEELRAIQSQLEEHQTLTTSEIAGLQSNVTVKLAALHTSLQSNSQQLTQLSTDMDTVDSNLNLVNASMREELRAIESQIEEHPTLTTSELAGLKSNVTSELGGLHASLQSNTQLLTQLSTNMDTLDSKLDSVNASMRAIESQLKEHQTLTTSELAGLQSNVTLELAGLQSNVTSELAGLQSNVTLELHTAMETYTHNEQLITKVDTLDSKLVSVNASMREEFRAIESQLEVHETQTCLH